MKKRGGCGAQQPNITVDGMKMVAEFKTTKKKTDEPGEMCPTLCFSMYICAKQAQMETRSPLVHPGTEKAIGVDLLVPPIVYPSRYSPDGVVRWTFVLGCVWLGHSYGHYKPCLCFDALIKLSVFPIYKPLPRGPGSSTSLARCLQRAKRFAPG